MLQSLAEAAPVRPVREPRIRLSMLKTIEGHTENVADAIKAEKTKGQRTMEEEDEKIDTSMVEALLQAADEEPVEEEKKTTVKKKKGKEPAAKEAAATVRPRPSKGPSTSCEEEDVASTTPVRPRPFQTRNLPSGRPHAIGPVQ